MEGDHSSEVYFYTPKFRFLLSFIITLLIASFFIFKNVTSFKNGEVTVGVVYLLLALLSFFVASIFIYKGVINPNPYLILTEEALILSATARNKKSIIPWEDIKGYEVQEIFFTKLIEIVRHDDKKYQLEMLYSRKDAPPRPLTTKYSILWRLIKRSERRLLVDELDRLTDRGPQLTNQLYPEMDTDEIAKQKPHNRVNKKYMFEAYIGSFAIAAVALFIFSGNDSSTVNTRMIIISFILYPFAKVLYDVIIGFKLNDKLDKQMFTPIQWRGLIFMIYLFLFIFSFVIAPIGFLYLIIRDVIRYMKEKKE